MNNTLDKPLVGTLTLRHVATTVIAVLTFAVISWVFFYPNDVTGDGLKQHDVMQGIANGQEGMDYYHQTGEISRWTDALFGGMPTFQIRPTYSSSPYLRWVENLYTLYFPEPVSWIFIMMLGFFILLMAFKVKWYLAVLGAIGYGFSSYFFILIGAGHIWKLLTLAYVPPTIAGIVWCYRGKYLGGAAVAALFAALQLMSNHVQMTYYFAFVIVALVLAYLAVAIKEKKLGRWCIATCCLAVAAMLAVAANSPNLYLSYKYSKETIRGGHSELTTTADGEKTADTASDGGLDKEYITQWSYGIDETFTLMIPNVKGGATIKPEKGDNKPLLLSETDKAKSMAENGQMDQNTHVVLSQMTQYFGDQPMTNGPVYVGIIIFALALLGALIVKGPVKWALVIVSILAVLLSWGHNAMWLTGWMIDHFPMYNKFRTPASILVIVEFTLPLLAVLGLHEMFKEDPKNALTRYKMPLIITGAVCVVICLAAWLLPNALFGTYSEQEQTQLVPQIKEYFGAGAATVDEAIATVRGALVSSDAMRSLLFLLLGAATFFVYARGKMNKLACTGVLALLVLVDMYTVDKRYVNEDTFVSAMEAGPEAFVPRPADTQILQDKDINYRVLDIQHFGDAMPSYFHKTVGGYHAAKLTRYNDLIERQLVKNNPQVLNMLNTRYVIASDTEVQRNPDALGNAWWVDTIAYVPNADKEMAFLDTFDASRQAVADQKFQATLGKAVPKQAGDTIVETAYAPNRLTYKSHSAKGGLAVFSEIYFPWGWTATIDGKETPIGRVNYVLRALQVPAGDHEIVFTYDPKEVHQTETLATSAIICIFAALLLAVGFAFLRNRKLVADPKSRTSKHLRKESEEAKA